MMREIWEATFEIEVGIDKDEELLQNDVVRPSHNAVQILGVDTPVLRNDDHISDDVLAKITFLLITQRPITNQYHKELDQTIPVLIA
jgi:hypothetical protein